MVLHLLGKKSWNVYNRANIDRVRRDEAEADARERAEEQRMQEEDAAKRIAALRGEPLPQFTTTPGASESAATGELSPTSHTDDCPPRERKRKRLGGEDDTDRAIRHAREDAAAGGERPALPLLSTQQREAPLHDHAGNIQLFPAPDDVATAKAEKNAELEEEKARKRKREEDQYTMRFSNAAGYQAGLTKPWYVASKPPPMPTPSTSMVLAEAPGKDVWGNEDARRKERERHRLSSNDPFAAMQHAQRQLKQSERDREAHKEKQRAEMQEMERAERTRERHRHSRRRRDDDADSLDGFSLDDPSSEKRKPPTRHDEHGEHRRHHRHSRRDRSPSRNHADIRRRHHSDRHRPVEQA